MIQIKKVALIVVSLFFIITTHAQQPTLAWAKAMGGIYNEQANAMVVDAVGNVYTTGQFTGTVDFDPGSAVFNLTPFGAAGNTNANVFITKLDAAGNFIWAKQMGGRSDNAYAIALDAAGNIYTTGTFILTADFDPGPGVFNLTQTGFSSADMFVSKLDAAGNFIWAKKIGGDGNVIPSSIAIDATGNVVTTGYLQSAYIQQTGVLLFLDFDSGPGVYNLTSSAAGGDADAFVSKLDCAGNFIWAKRFAGANSSQGKGLVIDASDNIITTGGFTGTADFDPGLAVANLTSAGLSDIYISKLDAAGNFIWAKRMGGIKEDYGYAIALDANGNIHTTGSFTGTADFDPGAGIVNLLATGNGTLNYSDIFVSKLDAAGNYIWAKNLGGSSQDVGISITESAKTDERKQFNNMLAFVKKSKEKISYIIVYSVDRFSRSCANAIYIAEKLKREGITVFAVTQPTDTTTASGSLQQNIQFIFSEYDNQLRREKCMAGVKEQLLNGIWCTAPPTGYDIIRREGKKEFILNKKGRLIKKIYSWKLEGLSLESIKEKLLSYGWNVDARRIADMLRNPFYCGLLAHSALEGQLVAGIQEKVISKELFLKVNGIMDVRQGGYSLQINNENVPLKRFIKCDNCSSYLTAYKAQKNQEYYYKCRTKGCNCNKRADTLHETFRAQLTSLNIKLDKELAEVIMQQMTATYNQLNKDKQETALTLRDQIQDIDKKLERLEERLIEEELNKQMFDKYSSKYLEEKKAIEKHLATFGNQVSNLEKSLDAVLGYASKLNTMWDSANYIQKQQLQKLIFPEGMYYSKKKDTCRTGRANAMFLCMSQLADTVKENKKGETSFETNFPVSVGAHGFEPRTLCL